MFFQTLTIAALALGASAQATASTTARASTTPNDGGAQTTISAFVGSGVAGSVVSANGCSTILALQCTDSDNYYCAQASQYGATEITVTQGPTNLEVNYATSTAGVTVALSASCDLQGTAPTFTAEVCTVSASVSAPGTSTTIRTSTSIASRFSQEPLPITAGASNLPAAGATCSATTSNMAMPTAAMDIYKILVPAGAAVVAGAGALF